MNYKVQDDGTLIRQMTEGHVEALAELYDRYNRLVFSIAFTIVGDRASASEITLDVFTRVWQRAESYPSDQANASSWLLAVARHKSIEVVRHQGVQTKLHSASWNGTAPQTTFQGLAGRKDLSTQRERIRTAVSHLSPEQQQILALAYFKGYTHHQIAELVKQPLGTVKTNIRSAMQKLRALTEEEFLSLDESRNSSAAYYNEESD